MGLVWGFIPEAHRVRPRGGLGPPYRPLLNSDSGKIDRRESGPSWGGGPKFPNFGPGPVLGPWAHLGPILGPRPAHCRSRRDGVHRAKVHPLGVTLGNIGCPRDLSRGCRRLSAGQPHSVALPTIIERGCAELRTVPGTGPVGERLRSWTLERSESSDEHAGTPRPGVSSLTRSGEVSTTNL